MQDSEKAEAARRFSVSVALVVLAMALLAVSVSVVASNGFSLPPFDQGWATFLGAVIGFGALSLQSWFSLRSVERSSREQSVRDREAREDRRLEEGRARLIQWGEERKTLAFALSGELSAAYTRINNALPMMKMCATLYGEGGDSPIRIQLHTILPRFEPSIYLANIAKLGVLGPSIVADVADVFQTLVNSTREDQPTELPAKFVATAIEGHIRALELWMVDQFHVQKRLLVIATGEEDPGALFFERERRRKIEATA